MPHYYKMNAVSKHKLLKNETVSYFQSSCSKKNGIQEKM